MSNSISRREFMRKSAGFSAMIAGGKWIFPSGPFPDSLGEEMQIGVAAGDDAFNCTNKAVDLFGGIRRFVPTGSKVALLPNSQSRHPGTYTGPDVIRATVRMCRSAGAEKIDALSWLPKKFWRASGLDEVLEEEKAGLVISGREDEYFKDVPIPEGRILKIAKIMKTLDDYDVLIDMPIVKDHAGNKFTGTMKNLMGLNAPNCNRTFHLENWETDPNDLEHLDQCIADLNLAVKPDLCIVDAMEIITTNGPFGPGKLVRPGKIAAGIDRVALDSYCTSFLGLKPKDIIMIRKGAEHGIGEMNLSKVCIGEAKV